MVAEDVRVLRREDDEAAVGELGTERVVILRLHLRIAHIGRPSFEAVLADDDGPLFAWLDVVGDQQNAVADHVLVEIEHDFVALPFRRVVDQARARIERSFRLRQFADDVFPEVIAQRLLRFLQAVEGRLVELRPDERFCRLRHRGAEQRSA